MTNENQTIDEAFCCGNIENNVTQLISVGQLVEARNRLNQCTENPLFQKASEEEQLKLMAQAIRVNVELGDFAQAQKVADQGHELEKQLLGSGQATHESARLALGLFFYEISIMNFSRAHYGRALSYAKAAEKMAPPQEEKLRFRALFSQATVMAYTGELDAAEKILRDLERECATVLPSLQSFICIIRGDIQRFRGDMVTAMGDYERALDLQKHNKNGKLYHSILLCLAKTAKALEHHEKGQMYLSLVENSIQHESFIRFNQIACLERVDSAIESGDFDLALSLIK